VPSEARNLALSVGAGTTLNWSAPVSGGGGAVLYDVLSSPTANGFTSASCLASNQSATTANDPSPDSAFYLVRAENNCGGSLGNDSTGSPIPGISCP
jgi:hypothetical protein